MGDNLSDGMEDNIKRFFKAAEDAKTALKDKFKGATESETKNITSEAADIVGFNAFKQDLNNNKVTEYNKMLLKNAWNGAENFKMMNETALSDIYKPMTKAQAEASFLTDNGVKKHTGIFYMKMEGVDKQLKNAQKNNQEKNLTLGVDTKNKVIDALKNLNK